MPTRFSHEPFAYYEIDPGETIHEHEHDEEEVWHLLDELEVSLGGKVASLHGGQAVVVPARQRQGVRALSACRVIIADYPVRRLVGGLDISTRPGAAM
jgi:quercetin dioxygenase-like cupin family protein